MTHEKIQALAKAMPTKLRRGLIAITLNTETVEDDSLLDSRPGLSEDQYVLAVGDMVKDIQVGDKVVLNLSALTKVRRVIGDSDQTISEIDIKTREVEGTLVGIVDERVVEQIYIK